MGISEFQLFMRDARGGQAIHRENLGDDRNSGSIMRGMSAATLQLAPQLQQQRQREMVAAPKPVPTFTPPSLGPGTRTPMPGYQPKPPRKNGGEKE